MFNNNLVIVTMTTWKLRINNVSTVVYSVLSGTHKPDKIILNLSIDEFPLKEDELPNSLLLLKKYTCFEINWVKENTKSFKKIIPVIQRYFKDPMAYIISIDDDIIYLPNFIQSLITKSNQYPNNYIIGEHSSISRYKNWVTTGCSCLYKPSFFSPFLWVGLKPEIIATNEDDIWYTFCLYLNKKNAVRIPFKINAYNEVYAMGKNHVYETSKTYKIISKFYSDLIL